MLQFAFKFWEALTVCNVFGISSICDVMCWFLLSDLCMKTNVALLCQWNVIVMETRIFFLLMKQMTNCQKQANERQQQNRVFT